MELIFTVKKDYLKPKTIGKPAVADSINHLIAVFEFDEAWDGYAKTAVFGNGLDTYGVLLEDDRCTIPWEVLDGSVMSRHFSVSVFGVKDDTRITSSKIKIPLEESGYGDFTNSETPSLTICEQIIAKFANYYTTEEADKAVDEKLSSYYTSTQTDKLLEEKVNTDQYASTTQAGIIKLAADSSGNNMSCIEVGADGSAKIKDGFGIKNAIGKLQIVAATSEMIDAKANPYFPITPSNLDYAVNSVENVNKLVSGYIDSYKKGIDVNTLIENGIYQITGGINTPDVPPTWEGGSTNHGTLIVNKLPGEDANRYYVTQIFIVGDDTGYGIWQRTLYITEEGTSVDVDWTDISGYTELKATKADKPTITFTVPFAILDDPVFTATISLKNNTEVRVIGEVERLAIELPETIDADFISSFVFTSGETATSMEYPETILMSGDDCIDNVFAPVANKRYTVIISYDGEYLIGDVRGVSI